jgi:DUF1680 family protein
MQTRRRIFYRSSYWPNRLRTFVLVPLFVLASGPGLRAAEQILQTPSNVSAANLAVVATASTSFVSGHETITALNDGFEPGSSDDKTHGAYGNWPRSGRQWVQYDWNQPITTSRMDVYWFDDGRGVRLPKGCRLQYWDGASFVTVTNTTGLGLAGNQFNTTTFPELTTSRLRLEFDSDGRASTGILEWRVYDSGRSPNFAPIVRAGPDRVVVLSGRTFLDGTILDDGKPNSSPQVEWAKGSGPGNVRFSEPGGRSTSAQFSSPGAYTLWLTANDGQLSSISIVRVAVDPAPPETHLSRVETTTYRISSPLWKDRTKNLIVNWIPHCVQKIDDPQLKEGGIDNFVQAANKLAGRPHKQHVGYPFSNAWVYNTIESICVALGVDTQGDADMIQTQTALRKTLEDWIPKVLSAQEPDGYLHTLYTIGGRPRWSNKSDHEGYNAGYFLEAAMAHYLMSGGTDKRLYDAAKRLADCWCEHIGPAPRRRWYEGHQEFEQALGRFAAFVDSHESPGCGRKYLKLAKFLLDCRTDGEEYDQSHVPVIRQYEAVGHAVRAIYSYSGMAEVAMATGDPDYYSAVKSVWNSIVNRKYYVTGGIGSGETSEGFGKDYSLPNRAYCESCADCGELFFQHKLQRAFAESLYADLYEETLYNAILGSVDQQAHNFTYTNPLDSQEKRYGWHQCPCCVGNIPRTLLMLPTWMYSTGPDALYVNLFIGSSVPVGSIAGAPVEVEQTTDYPWDGKVKLTVKPSAPARFSIKIRVPNRNVSQLYSSTPDCGGILSLAVNSTPIDPVLENGYATVRREWKAGDTIELELPMKVQRVRAVSQVLADAGKVALRYGPLLYNIESVDQDVDATLKPDSTLSTEMKPDLLGGVVVIKGTFASGAPMMAIPNFARLNRGGRSLVWIKEQ